MNHPLSHSLHPEARSAAIGMIACVSVLALIGLAAGVSSAPPGAAWHMLGLRALHCALGLGVFLVCFALPVEKMRQIAPPALGAVFVVLLVMLVSDKFGHTSHRAERWVQVGPIRLQPSAFLQWLWPVFLALAPGGCGNRQVLSTVIRFQNGHPMTPTCAS